MITNTVNLAVLLLEIMACGAVYSNETEVAMAMHNNVLKLLLKVSAHIRVSLPHHILR
jgi:hypothetical protein